MQIEMTKIKRNFYICRGRRKRRSRRLRLSRRTGAGSWLALVVMATTHVNMK